MWATCPCCTPEKRKTESQSGKLKLGGNSTNFLTRLGLGQVCRSGGERKIDVPMNLRVFNCTLNVNHIGREREREERNLNKFSLNLTKSITSRGDECLQRNSKLGKHFSTMDQPLREMFIHHGFQFVRNLPTMLDRIGFTVVSSKDKAKKVKKKKEREKYQRGMPLFQHDTWWYLNVKRQ